VESWEAAIKIWNDNCEVYHKAGCPAPVRPAAPRSVPPAKKTTTREVHHKARTNTAFEAGFRMGKDASSAAAFEAGFRMGMGASSAAVLPPLPPSASASRVALSPHTSPATPRPKNSQPTTTKQLNVGPRVKLPRTSPSTPRPAASPSSPRRLSEMDPVEAFSLMGVANPALQPPLKQWAIGGVNKFFAQRYVRLLVSIPACADLKDPELMRWTISSRFIWGRQISWGLATSRNCGPSFDVKSMCLGRTTCSTQTRNSFGCFLCLRSLLFSLFFFVAFE
jgi:hypothetical protein